MSISVWCEIVCAQCSRTAPGLFADRSIPKRHLIARARNEGWAIRADEAFCSTRCEKAFTAEEASAS